MTNSEKLILKILLVIIHADLNINKDYAIYNRAIGFDKISDLVTDYMEANDA